MRYARIAVLLFAAALAAGCGGGEKSTESATPVENAAPPVPDVGGVTRLEVTTKGTGSSASEAMSEAMKLAILEVNGAVVDTATLTMKFGLDVTDGQDSASLRGSAFADLVAQRSGGVIQSLKVVDIREPGMMSKFFEVTIKASIAKFQQSKELERIRIVVATPRFDSASVPMGDQAASTSDVAETIRQRLTDALTQTGRFAVLDRETNPELERELGMISDGSAPSEELSKLGQAVSADVLLTTKITRFAYDRHARTLRASGRELVSYDGGWSATHSLVNVATRQVTASGTLSGEAPSVAPTTMSSGVDPGRVMQEMVDAMIKGIVASVMSKTFPVSIVARDGADVVLSQGGQALTEGTRYRVNRLGKELKDPQTGQSLGRVESPCCELVVTRVAANLSYGRLENLQGKLDDVPVGGLLVGEKLSNGASAATNPVAPVEAAGSQPDGASAGVASRVVESSLDPQSGDALPLDVSTPADEPKDEKW